MGAFAWSVTAAGWAALVALLFITSVPSWPVILFFWVTAVVMTSLTVQMPRGGYQAPDLAVVAAGLIEIGPVYIALVMGTAYLISHRIIRRRSYSSALFSSGQAVVSILFAGGFFSALHPKHPDVHMPFAFPSMDVTFVSVLVGSLLTYMLFNSLLVSTMIASTKGQSIGSVMVPNVLWGFANNMVFATIGVTMALISRNAIPPEPILLIIPLVLVGYILMIYSTREEAHQELAVLERIGRGLLTLDREELYQTMYEQVRAVMPVDTFYVSLFDADHDTLAMDYLIDSGTRFPNRPSRFSPRLREVVTTRTSKLINRLSDDLERASDPVEKQWRVGTDRPSASLIFAPIVKGDQVIGVLSVQSYTTNAYKRRHLRLIEALATQAASAIENARLFETNRRGLDRLTMLQRISSVVVSSLEMDKVFQAIAESARQVLDVTRCAIYLRDEQTGTITGVYSRGLSERYVEAVKRSYEHSAGGLLGRSREPMIISDGQTDARLELVHDTVVSEGIHTMCLLPLLYHDDIVGALSFYHDQIRPYSPDDILLATAIANGAAVAMKNAILLSQTQRRAAEAALLNQVMAVITETLDFKEIAWRVVEVLARNFGYSRVCISEREGDTLTVLAQVGYSHLRVPMPISTGICGRVVRSGKPVLVGDVAQDSDYVAQEPDTKSLIIVPIHREEQVVAVLRIDSTEGRLLTGADLDLLVSVAQQLTAASRNAVLYEQARQAQEELRALYEAAKSISSSLELQAVLDNLVRVTCQAFGYELGAILLVDERSSDLVVEAIYGYSGILRGKRIPSGKGITGAVQQTGKPALIPDVREDSRYIGFTEETASEIAVPLIIEGRVIGVFNVESPRYQAFGEHDLKILTTLAGFATIAIANARLYEQTKRLSITDGLTELYNHRYLNEVLARALERAIRDSQPLSVVMLEIDNFKHCNDTFGHQRGDEVLRIVADLLRKTSRPTDFAARYGGDEFLIVLPNTGKGAAQDFAERIRRAVESYPFILGGSVVTSVTLSVGVASSPEDGVTVDAIVEAVDRAQYTAKRTGGNKVHSTRPLAQQA